MSLINMYDGKKDYYSTIKSFVNNFVSDVFFADVMKVALYPSEFNLVSVNGNNSLVSYIRQFFADLTKMCDKIKMQDVKKIKTNTELVTTLLNIRESGSGIISYDNVFNHLGQLELSQEQLVQKSISKKLKSETEFRKCINQIVNSIQAYYEVNKISSSIITFDKFSEYASQPGVSVFEAIKMFKDNVITLYNDLSNLRALDKYESEKDYFVIGDKNSTKSLAEALVDFVGSGYSFFRTGYDLIDNNVDGAESSSVHLISAPSNHGKSIFLVNLAHRIVQENINDFDEGDCVLFITLEDAIQKLARRFCSIFGNVRQSSVKSLYRRSYEALKANSLHGLDNGLEDKIVKMFQNLLTSSIHSVTTDKVSLVIKHCQENVFSPGDIGKFIDRLKIEGLNVKLLFVDYIDVMAPSINRYTNYNDYQAHGQITQELRILSQQYKIPVFTATQNTRGSENVNQGMNNSQVGDSIRKVRYSDYIYMARQDNTKDPFDPALKQYVIPNDLKTNSDQLSPEILKKQDQICSNLIPFEIKITKAKEGGKDKMTYMLFCKENLRLYNNLGEYLADLSKLESGSRALEKDIEILTSVATSSISEDFADDYDEKTNEYMSAPFLSS